MADPRTEKFTVWGLGILCAVLAINTMINDTKLRRMREAIAILEPTYRPSGIPGDARLLFADAYFCENDCSGHLAGWRWARKTRARSGDDCSGSGSSSFAEGCDVYLWATGRADQPG